MTKSSLDKPKFSSALATALLIVLAMGSAAAWGINLNTSNASSARIPRTRLTIRLALIGEPGTYLLSART
jgi:hypothetical protein